MFWVKINWCIFCIHDSQQTIACPNTPISTTRAPPLGLTHHSLKHPPILVPFLFLDLLSVDRHLGFALMSTSTPIAVSAGTSTSISALVPETSGNVNLRRNVSETSIAASAAGITTPHLIGRREPSVNLDGPASLSTPQLASRPSFDLAAPPPVTLLSEVRETPESKWTYDPNDPSLRPYSNFVDSLLTDLYQITMLYAYWKSKRHDDHAVFDLFFRKNPFKGYETARCSDSISACFICFVFLMSIFKPRTPHLYSLFFPCLSSSSSFTLLLPLTLTPLSHSPFPPFPTPPQPNPSLRTLSLHSEFTIFAGLEDVLRFLHVFKFTDEDCAALRKKFPKWDPAFWSYLHGIDASKVTVYAIEEGSIVFPREPLLRVEGPLGVCQLLETTILVLVNFSSLVTTNAARHRLAVGPGKTLLEFGLRRAQGPDGAMSASRYSYLGGFDGTSNVKAGIMHSLALSGTHAHSYVAAFTCFEDLATTTLVDANGEEREFVALVKEYRQQLNAGNTNTGELAAYTSYAQAFPDSFLALIDTYDTLESGLLNFLAVSLALVEFGYQPRGVRLDSGDLAYLSKRVRQAFLETTKVFGVQFDNLLIVASNDLSEEVLWSLKEQGHEVDTFAIGTNLVTCSTQPALGCVYKLVEVRGEPRIKISHDSSKVTIPGRKECFRLYNSKNQPVIDIMAAGEEAKTVVAGQRVLCRHPFDANKRVFVTPSRVENLHKIVWQGKLLAPFPNLVDLKRRVLDQLSGFREDHLRHLNPTPYKVSLTSDLFTYMHDLWLHETPVMEIS